MPRKILPRKELESPQSVEPIPAKLVIHCVDEAWIADEIVKHLTFALCQGWQHVKDQSGDRIEAACRSITAAHYLFRIFDAGPLASSVVTYLNGPVMM